MNILTFNHHESYINSLAATGHEFFVVTRYKKLNLDWNPSGAVPQKNIHCIAFDAEIKQKLQSSFFDVVICHTIKNLIWLFLSFRQRFIFIGHITLRRSTLNEKLKSFAKKSILKIFCWFHSCQVVMVSPFKAETWGINADIILLTPGLFPTERLESGSGIIVVGNHIKQRGAESGWDLIDALRKIFPISIIGSNPDIPEAIKPKNHQEFLQYFRRGTIFLFTTRPPYNDGYNTAMLEAMSLGMAVVTIEHPSSPIQHGINGLVGKNEAELAGHLSLLLKEPETVQKLGEAAKKTIKENFSLEKFVSRWQNVLTNPTSK